MLTKISCYYLVLLYTICSTLLAIDGFDDDFDNDF